MPIQINYLDNGMGVHWLGQGVLSEQDLLEASKITFEPVEKLKLIRYALINFESIEKHSLETGSIKRKVSVDRNAASINPDVAVALVATNDELFGFSRMWENYAYGIGWKTNVFRSKVEAERWIKATVKERIELNATIGSLEQQMLRKSDKKFINRRKYHRIKFKGQANLDFINDRFDHCLIKNLSLTGMLVTGKFRQKQDEDCFINLNHKTISEYTRLEASGKVAWCNEEGVGIKFTSMTFDSYMSLVTLLINNAEQPTVILHEFPKDSPFELTSF